MATSASSALLIQHRPGLLWYSMVCLHVCDSAKILLKHLFHLWIWFSSVQSVMPDSLWPHGLQHTRLPCLSPTPRASSNSYPSSRWCHPTIPASVISFSSCLQSFPASGSFLRISSAHQLAKVLELLLQLSPTNDYSRLISFKLTGLISLPSKGFWRVFSNTKVQKHQFFST